MPDTFTELAEHLERHGAGITELAREIGLAVLLERFTPEELAEAHWIATSCTERQRWRVQARLRIVAEKSRSDP